MSNAVILKHTKDKNVKYTAHFTCFRIHKLKWIFLHFLDRIISWVSAQAPAQMKELKFSMHAGKPAFALMAECKTAAE